MYRYVVIKPNGTIESSLHKKAPDWREAQKYVEGPFQILSHFSSLIYEDRVLNRGTAYANEEGRLRGMEHNEAATRAWMRACPKGHPARMQLCGPILFVAKEK
jgi:hypothetical protein